MSLEVGGEKVAVVLRVGESKRSVEWLAQEALSKLEAIEKKNPVTDREKLTGIVVIQRVRGHIILQLSDSIKNVLSNEEVIGIGLLLQSLFLFI